MNSLTMLVLVPFHRTTNLGNSRPPSHRKVLVTLHITTPTYFDLPNWMEILLNVLAERNHPKIQEGDKVEITTTECIYYYLRKIHPELLQQVQ